MEDGVDHINIYSKGKTELGRMLSNFYKSEFEYKPYGKFQSVEGFWYYYLTGCKHDYLKGLYGFKAKQEGQKLRDDRQDKDGLTATDVEILLEAIRCKLRQNRRILKLLIQSSLPFKHYYCYGDKVIYLPQYDWIVDEIERIRSVCKQKLIDTPKQSL